MFGGSASRDQPRCAWAQAVGRLMPPHGKLQGYRYCFSRCSRSGAADGPVGSRFETGLQGHGGPNVRWPATTSRGSSPCAGSPVAGKRPWCHGLCRNAFSDRCAPETRESLRAQAATPICQSPAALPVVVHLTLRRRSRSEAADGSDDAHAPATRSSLQPCLGTCRTSTAGMLAPA
jgi:hypothetical protein